MAQRNAASVLPDPVGASSNVCLPSAMADQPCSCALVGASNVDANHSRVGSEKRSRADGADFRGTAQKAYDPAVTISSPVGPPPYTLPRGAPVPGIAQARGYRGPMDALRWESRPALTRPVLVVAFEGWGDAGEAASGALRYLEEAWSARSFASIDPEEFYDFTATRPRVRVEGTIRQIDWPELTFSTARPSGSEHDVILLTGPEPALKWRTFTEHVVRVARELGVEFVLTLGGMLADVAHTKPVLINGTTTNEGLIQRFGFRTTHYEGPSSMLSALSAAFATAGIPAAGLWAGVPVYVHQSPSPKASLALVEKVADILGAGIDVVDLQLAAAAYERQVSEVVSSDEDVAAYVTRLEEQGDDLDPDELPSADALAAEAERFLRGES